MGRGKRLFVPIHRLSKTITGNRIGDIGALALSEALKTNTTLTTLDIMSKTNKTHVNDIH